MSLARLAVSYTLSCLFAVGGVEAQPDQGEGPSQPANISMNARRPVADSGQHYPDGSKKWTPETSIALSHFSDEPAQFSPDGRYFFLSKWHGDLSCDCSVVDLMIYETAAVQEALARQPKVHAAAIKPFRTLTSSNGGFRSGRVVQISFSMSRFRWGDEGDTIYYRGLDGESIQQYYRYSVDSGKIEQITRWKNDNFGMYKIGRTIVTHLNIPNDRRKEYYPVVSLNKNVIAGEWLNIEGNAHISTQFIFSNQEPYHPKGIAINPFASISFNKEGSRAIFVGQPVDEESDEPVSWGAGSRFYILDLNNRTQKPLRSVLPGEGRPGYPVPSALLLPDHRRVILINARASERPGTDEREAVAGVIEYDLESEKPLLLEPIASSLPDGSTLVATNVQWAEDGTALMVKHIRIDQFGNRLSDLPATTYRREGDRWVGRKAPVAAIPPRSMASTGGSFTGLTIKVQEDENSPQVAVASNGSSDIALTGSDPALEGIWVAKQKRFEWALPDGTRKAAGLLLPRDAAGPLPLVIQVYRYSPDIFAPDGPDLHAYAGQSLVARGIAVLNIDIPAEDMQNVPNASYLHKPFADRIDSVIDALVSQGIADPGHIGMIGFSNAGFQIYYYITHPGRYKISAAVMDDNFSGSFAEEITEKSLGGPNHVDILYGKTFWEDKRGWIAEDPLFNIERNQTPSLFAIHRRSQVLYPNTLATIAAFDFTHRPLEYLLFPYGAHTLGMPKQRLESQRASLDWLSFWLQGAIPADPDRARRWINIKSAWERQRAWEGAGHPLGSTPDANFWSSSK